MATLLSLDTQTQAYAICSLTFLSWDACTTKILILVIREDFYLVGNHKIDWEEVAWVRQYSTEKERF